MWVGLTRAEYNINKLSRAENDLVVTRIKPNILTDWEKM